MNEKDQEFGSDEQLEKHAREYHGLSLAQFKLMCEEAHKRYEGQFSSSVDKALAVDSFYEGFKVAIKEALEQPAQEPVMIGDCNAARQIWENNLKEAEKILSKCKFAKSDDEQPAQEPVAWTYEALGWMEREGIDLANELADKHIAGDDSGIFNIKLRKALCQLSKTVYSQSQKIVELVVKDTHPHQVVPTSTWQRLTDDENEVIIQSIWEWGNDFPYEEYRRAIEQALKEKNNETR